MKRYFTSPTLYNRFSIRSFGPKAYALSPRSALDQFDFDPQSLSTVRDHINRILSTEGGFRLPIWKSHHGQNRFEKHIASLGIPLVQESPSLLLHDLGCTTHDKRLNTRVSELFRLGSYGHV